MNIRNREVNTSIHLMKGHISNCTGGFKDSGEEQEFLAVENVFSKNGEVRCTQDQQRGGHCIHEPIFSDIVPKNETGVYGMETDLLIYIHFPHFSLLSHSPTMVCRHGNQPC